MTTSIILNVPSKEELDRTAQYQNKIPNYQCVSYTSLNNGQIKVGVLKADPSYCNRNIGDATPPNCQDVGQNPEANNMNQNTNINMYMNMNMNMNMNNNMRMDSLDAKMVINPTDMNSNDNQPNMNINDNNGEKNTFLNQNNILNNNGGGLDSKINLNGDQNMNMNNNEVSDDDDDDGDAPYLDV